ncbi:unnamed protein product [Aureobasidium uvarum]|uniref:Uncharacterized protein n=1 Tax=Aureobasidium uvarum TaxID=2773716 RepID=A0A9N8KFM4_9PEZI|nr:unnamed protein product [Aureobasidium uvarum]
MCWGVQDHIFCELCRHETALDINWLGCQHEFCEVHSPVCQNPIISKLITYRSCQTCITEANDGGNPDDIYPEPFAHPGFSDTKPVIPVDRVQFPEPTAYESCSNVENLAGPADELPSYEDAMNDMPSPPSYDLAILRYNEPDPWFAARTAYDFALERHQQLMDVAQKYRQHIRKFLTQGPSADTIKILDYATEIIESFLFDQEQRISRIDLLGPSLGTIYIEIDLLPSPPEMALLEQKRQSIIRELEGYAERHSTLESAEDWDLRLESLLTHVSVEMASATLREIDEMMASVRAMRANASST